MFGYPYPHTQLFPEKVWVRAPSSGYGAIKDGTGILVWTNKQLLGITGGPLDISALKLMPSGI